MNRIYRSIWNQATGAYAAVSENVKSAGKRSMPGSSGGGAHFALTGMAAALMLGYGSLALAGPAGGTVVAGQATINGAPGVTVIRQGSQNAVINWASFNIGKGESVQFQQPNSNAVALNRVLGSDGTTILGNLSANGKVFIVNPNGVLFGRGASVNTAGLVASTLDISNADFMAGNYKFSGNGSGKVLNQGSISAPGGYVALLGANVSNEGTIQARLGSVALAAGRAITLDVAGDGLLNVAVDQGAVGALVHNGGMIKADGGSVVLTAQAAGDLLKTVVNNTGVIEAHTIDTRGGTIKLLGDMQSGTVHAGGTLDASAPAEGNGGFIDTSAAHVKIDDALKVTTASSKGLSGTWLIDPTDFNIAVSGGDMTGAFLSNSLKSGNVQIQSVSGGSGTQGNINVNDNVNWTANKLTLTAQNNININKAMRGAGTASLALEYGQSVLAAGNLSTYNVKAEVDLPSGNNFSTKLGSNGSVVVYQVINSLGAFNSTTGSDVQGMQGNLSGNYVLGSNIDARGTSGWDGGQGFVPIGSAGTPFTGKFDGLGHELYGLTINRPETPAAMFGNIGVAGSVRNLSLSNVNISGSQAAYGAAYTDIGALAGRNNGTIENVSSSGAVHGSGYINMGALVGTNAGTLSNSRAAGTVVAGAYGAAGGLVGVNAAGGLIKGSSSAVATTSTNYFAGGLAVFNRGTISDSYATGAISVGSAGGSYGGGLAAINTGGGTVTNSYATGNVTGTSGLGGLVGRIESGAVTNSYATGNVTGTNNLGGLVGVSAGPISNSYATGNVTGNSTVGGVVGYNIGVALTNTYYSGKLTTTGINNGAIVGDHNGGSIVNAYFNNILNSGLSAVGVVSNGASTVAQGLSAAQMLQGSNFTGFNFTSTAGATGNNWVIVSGDGSINGAAAGTRPMLASEWSNTINSTHQLQLMAMNKAASYTLGSSFSAAGTAANGNDVWGSTGFIPVGTAASAFTGSLDGTGHIISNLNIAKAGVSDVGLFGAIGSGGAVANVGLSGGSVAGGTNVGALAGSNAGTISGSFATSGVTSTSTGGGLVGSNTGTVVDSYASGTVSGTSTVGGLVGSNGGSIANSYANGGVSGTSNVGGLVGANAGSVTGSYWDTVASGQANSMGGTGKTTAQLKNLSNYTGAGWELGQMWVVYDGQSAPFLRSFMKQVAVRVSYDSKVYDGVAYAGGSNSVTYSNTVAGASLLGTPVYAGNAAGAVNAGTYGVSASGLYSSGGQSGYAISYIDGGLVITPKSVTLSGAAVGDKVYDGTTVAAISGTLNGVLAGDLANVSSTVNGTYASKNAGNGIAVTVNAALGGSAGGNYALAPVNGLTGNISKATISGVSGIVAGNKVYDGTATASLNTAGATFAGMVGGDSLSVSGASGSFGDKNAATGKAVSISGIVLGGTDAGNYNLTNATASSTADISKATITGVAGIVAGNKVYDGGVAASLNTAGASFTGMVGGDSLTVSGASGSFTDKNASNGKTVNISGITLGGTDAGNYNFTNTLASSTANISKATISGVSGIVAGNKVYDGTATAGLNTAGATFAGMVGGDTLNVSAASGSFSDKNAGTGKAVSISGIVLGGTDAGNYNLASSTAGSTADITAKALTLTGLSGNNKVYDGTADANLTGGTLNGLVNAETLGFAVQGASYSDKNAGTGKAITIGGVTLSDGSGLAGNYTLSAPGGLTGDIAKATITGITGLSAEDKVYNGNLSASLSAGLAVINGKIAGDDVQLSSANGAFTDKNVGTNKAVNISNITLSGSDLGNYNFSNNTATATANITPKAVTLSGVTADNKVYDGTTAAVLSGGTLSGMVAGETLSFSGGVGSFSDKNAGTAKVVAISGTTLQNGTGLASNYTFTSPGNVTADISKASISGVSNVGVNNKTYDGQKTATLNGTATFTGIIGDDSLTVAGNGEFSDKNAGTGKTVNVSGITLGGADAGNYLLGSTTSSGVADIAKASIGSVSNVGVNNKTYDASATATLNGAATFNGMVNGDSLTVAGNGAFSDKNAGTGKTVNVSNITLGGADAGNYLLGSTTSSGVADIAKASISGVSNVGVNNKTYDGQKTATLNGTATFTGIFGDDSLTVAGNGEFSDKNAGTGKTVNVSNITLAGADAGNYLLGSTTSSGVADIAKASIGSVSNVGVSNKTYDGLRTATLNGTATFDGIIGNDSLSVAGSALFSDKNAGTAKVAMVSGITLAGADAGNYILGSNVSSGTADITPKALTVTGQVAGNKVYDGNAVAQLSGGSLAGLVGDETLAIGGQTAAFSDKNAGNAKAVTVSGTTLLDGTGSASNYTVANPTGLTASITPASISAIAGIVAANKVYDGGTAASLNLAGATFNGLVAGDALSLAGGPVLGAFSDKNAARGKTVTISGLALGGADAANYVLASSLASTTADITPAALTVSASGVNKVYDATTNAVVSLRDNRLGNDQLSIASDGASFSDKNAGAGKTVTVAGIRLSGADAGNYVVNSSASTTATISQAALTVKVDNAEKDQGRANPDFRASYSGLLGGDTLAAEVSGNLAFSTPAATTSAAGNYLVSASGQASNNYALNYVDGVLTVKPTEALQSAVANVIAAVAVAPSQGNMVQADMIVSGETAPGKPAAAQEAPREAETGSAGSAPAVQLAGNVVGNVLPGLRLSVVDSGLRLPAEAGGNTRQDSQ
ncbi:filamentous hemagglutinin N-terminal domain-containing protein [Janthinobacterium sp. FW305-129]|uniref:YDG domain-containing protein n=1 Tax=Janthinobacterium sp. FW305-129 TaxID=2775054 RepID=UPI001E4142C9|nr:YDG domain-containing protein [Janthinobacterium sp. FW305-129]MCC7600256.1 filamentous hemagglutinin N-terminal domain-containing protein [Janthinobacterium sp. FW305-129]